MQWCFFEKQIGGNRDGRNQPSQIHFDSPVKIIEKEKKAANIQRLTNNEQHSTPSLLHEHVLVLTRFSHSFRC